jgi:hypothetical protein
VRVCPSPLLPAPILVPDDVLEKTMSFEEVYWICVGINTMLCLVFACFCGEWPDNVEDTIDAGGPAFIFIAAGSFVWMFAGAVATCALICYLPGRLLWAVNRGAGKLCAWYKSRARHTGSAGR